MSDSQLLSLAYIPKITGGLSMIGSLIICYDILKNDRKAKLEKVYTRLLLAMSVGDFFLSLTFFLSTWPTPRDAPTIWSVGTKATCTLQGYFQQFFVTSIFYNAWLSIYYVMVIIWGWRDKQIVPYEMFAHFFSFTFSVTTATIALVRGYYDTNFVVWCFISTWKESMILNIGWQWACFLIVVGCMVYLWYHIRKQLRTTQKYGESQILRSGGSTDANIGESTVSRPKKKKVKGPKGLSLITTQALLYAGAYFLTESSNIIITIFYYMEPVSEVPIEVIQYGVIVLPLQGMWNCLIYFRPRYLAYRNKQKQEKKRKQAQQKSNEDTALANTLEAGTSVPRSTATNSTCLRPTSDMMFSEKIEETKEEEQPEEYPGRDKAHVSSDSEELGVLAERLGDRLGRGDA